jgi:starch synthase
MPEKMKVLLVTAEAFPFAKVGGLADVAGSLPEPLNDLNIDIRVILPLYDAIDRAKFGIEYCGVETSVTLGERHIKAKLWASVFPGTQIPAYFVECPEYYGRPGIYTDPATGEAYPDDGERFVFFSKAVLELVKFLGWKPDIIHCNDYQTGIIPALVKLRDPDDDTGFLYSIHNLAYQGRFGREIIDLIGVGHDKFYPMGDFEFHGEVNFMKIGILYSDVINTVSPTYAQEIQSTSEYGYGLEGVLSARTNRLFGILNGIDQKVWNPKIDPDLPANYSKKDKSGKTTCKVELQKEVGLPEKPDSPLIGIISRLADQKGFDILIPILDEILKRDVMIVLLGTGKKEYEAAFEAASAKHPDKMAAIIGFKGALSHRIEAGSDMFLMPSRYEPCGLNQMYSMAYGTVPVVRKTGGLADTVTPADLTANSGTGFVFERYTSEELLKTIDSALEAYSDKKGWEKLMDRCMEFDSSWGASADKYIGLYRQAVSLRRYNV